MLRYSTTSAVAASARLGAAPTRAFSSASVCRVASDLYTETLGNLKINKDTKVLYQVCLVAPASH